MCCVVGNGLRLLMIELWIDRGENDTIFQPELAKRTYT